MAVSLDIFLARVQESALLSPEEIASFLAAWPGSSRASAETLARELVRQEKLTPYQAQEIYAGRGKSLLLGNYRILDKIGQGGMGMVLKAVHRRMERTVALKMISQGEIKSPDALQRFHREVKAAARLNHPHIVTAYDADEAGGIHFLVMEYVEGTNLSQLVKQCGPLSIDQALSCILQAARGLDFAHGKGVIHRDIKPGNLLIDAEGTVKILDMGLARIEHTPEQGELTGSSQVMGTVDYMAPEQAQSTRSVDGRADIYSLGVSLWYLLTGRPVYEGETLIIKLMAHASAPIPSLRAARKEVSPELDAIFQRMIAKAPADRYQSMKEVIAALDLVGRERGESPPTIAWPRPASAAPLPEFVASGDGPLAAFASRPISVADAGAEPAPTIDTRSPHADTDPKTEIGAAPAWSFPSLPAALPAAEESPPWWKQPAIWVAAAAGLSLLVFGIWAALGSRPDPGRVAIQEAGSLKPPSPTGTNATPRPIAATSPLPAQAPFPAEQARQLQAAWAKHLGLAIETPNSLAMKMVVIPPGSFQMGRSPSDAANLPREKLDPSDLPPHRVTIQKPFALSATEVTQRQWQAVMGSEPWRGQKQAITDPDCPATYVSWQGANDFCRRLSTRENATYRLPTEAEWECACRAGTHTSFSFGDNSSELGRFAWTRQNSQDLPHPVAQKLPNPWGLFDIHGNAWEWTADGFAEYSAEDATDPIAEGSIDSRRQRVLRGGCFWSVPTADYRSSARRPWPEGLGYSESGFRVVREIDLSRTSTRPAASRGASLSP